MTSDKWSRRYAEYSLEMAHNIDVKEPTDSNTLWQTAIKVEEHSAEIHLNTKKLKIIVNGRKEQITIKNINGEILFQEGARQIVPGVVLDEKV